MAGSFDADGLRSGKPFDSSVFSDPLARTISWEPLEYWGNLYCHKLVKRDSLCLEFKTTFGIRFLYSLFLFMAFLICSFPWIFMVIRDLPERAPLQHSLWPGFSGGRNFYFNKIRKTDRLWQKKRFVLEGAEGFPDNRWARTNPGLADFKRTPWKQKAPLFFLQLRIESGLRRCQPC